MNTWKVFGVFVLVRLASVFLVDTWYVPDEYWQSLEVAHKFVYGYGYLTWEWSKGIRSYAHPILISLLYKVLNLIGLDSADFLIFAPRIFQAILSAFSDVCFWKWCGKTKWSIFCIATSWFWFYTASRTLLNTLETCLTTITLSYYPFVNTKNHYENPNKFIWFLGLICAIRPTGAIVWLPLCIYHLFTSKQSIFKNIVFAYLPAVLITVIASCLVDSLAHGSFVITWWEFLKLNLFEGVGDWYGTQPWHWYLSQGFPAILGVFIIPFLISSIHILKNRKVYVNELVLLATITFTIFVYSLLSHKEFRFILPLLPISLYISSTYLTNWSRKANEHLIWAVAAVIFVGNLIPALYLGVYHQRGTLDVMKPLREISLKDPTNTNLLFLMPCHSTPLYSHLHVNVTARFLTCNPNLSGVDNYVDEADYFYKNPGTWLTNNYINKQPLPTHIVTFDKLDPFLSDILSRYKPILRLYHSFISQDARIGRYVMIHERIDT